MNFLGDLGATTVNTLGSIVGGAIGNKNLIPTIGVDPNWQNANRIATGIGGQVGHIGADIAANAIAPGVGGALMSGVQKGVGNATQGINNNQFDQPIQQPQMSAPQLYGIPTGTPAAEYGQGNATQQFNNGGVVQWNPYMTFNKGGRVGYWMGGRLGYTDGTPGLGMGGFSLPENFGSVNNPGYQPGLGNNVLTDTSANMFGNQGVQGNVFDTTGGGGTIPSGTNSNITGGGLKGYIPYASAGLGLLEAGIGLHGLNQLQKQAMPQYLASTQLNAAHARAQKMAEMGFTPQETAAFHNNLATSNNTAFANATQASGGQLSGAINAGLQSQNIGALNQFAGQDAALKRENMRHADSFASQFQNIQDENTRTALQQRMMREQALGGAVNSGLTNLTGAINLAGASRAGQPTS